MHLSFEFPTNLTVAKLLAELSHFACLTSVTSQQICKTYYDSFDWRLYNNGMSCGLIRSKTVSSLVLERLDSGQILAIADVDHVDAPLFAGQLPCANLRNLLEPILDMRALLTVGHMDYQCHHLNITNNDEKIVLHLVIEEYPFLNHRLFVQPLKGDEKITEDIIEILGSKLHLTPACQSLLFSVADCRPGSYSSKLNIQITSDMRADRACKDIYSRLLTIINTNRQGVIDNTDSEFLHDFRVAVRKTRAGLSQLKGVLPDSIGDHFALFFAWLGQETGSTRDLDVYLLNFARYKNSLPLSIREDIDPLRDFLINKHKQSQQKLVEKLRSARCTQTLAAWGRYLHNPTAQQPEASPCTQFAVKQLADKRLWKLCQRVLHDGRAINTESTADTFHDLRKTCKKLRYLMEFFQTLYPEAPLKELLKKLQGLQAVLGDIQDYQVQETQLKQFSEEMLVLNFPVSTFLAMGALIQNLETSRCQARQAFKAKFSDFEESESWHIFAKA